MIVYSTYGLFNRYFLLNLIQRKNVCYISHKNVIYLTKITAAQNEVTLSYHRVSGLYFKAVIFVATILSILSFSREDPEITACPNKTCCIVVPAHPDRIECVTEYNVRQNKIRTV